MNVLFKDKAWVGMIKDAGKVYGGRARTSDLFGDVDGQSGSCPHCLSDSAWWS